MIKNCDNEKQDKNETATCPKRHEDFDFKKQPHCAMLRFGDSNLMFVDFGARGVKNWYTLAREGIPEELRDEGYDHWNFTMKYEIPFKPRVQASSVAKMEYAGNQMRMPGSDLTRISNYWKKLS